MAVTAAAQFERDITRARTLPKREPTADDLVDAARLLMRYPGVGEDCFGYAVRLELLGKLLEWGLSVDDLNQLVRAIWAEGYRPGQIDVGYGSGADVGAGQ